MSDWTYKTPEPAVFLRNLAKILARSRKDLAPHLSGARCAFEVSSTYGSRSRAYTVSVRLSVRDDALRHLEGRVAREALCEAAHKAIQPEAGLDVVDVQVVPVLDGEDMPADALVSDALNLRPDFEDVRAAWRKALDRRDHDPDGTITISRTLLESMLKHISDEVGVPYDAKTDLPSLYNGVAKALRLAPGSRDAAGKGLPDGAKQILAGCYSVVQGFAALRNQLGDAHGKGKGALRAEPRHAELAANMAFSLATFLVRTLDKRRKGGAP